MRDSRHNSFQTLGQQEWQFVRRDLSVAGIMTRRPEAEPAGKGDGLLRACTPPQVSPDAPTGSAYPRFLQRLRRRYADLLPLLPPGAPDHHSMAATLATLLARGEETGAALRILRQLVMERLATLDCDASADLSVVTHGMTALAELALQTASDCAQAELDLLHGAPTTEGGVRATWWWWAWASSAGAS